MKRIFIAFFSLVLVLTPVSTFADDIVVICFDGETREVPESDLIEYPGAIFSECDPGDENHPPVFSGFNPPTEASACEPYYYDVDAEDFEDDNITFILDGPGIMAIDSLTGIIDWTPTEEDVSGEPFEVLVGIYDGTSLVETSFYLTVSEGSCEKNPPAGGENTPPVIEGPDYASTTTGELLEFEVTFSDPQGDDLTLELILPDGATYDEALHLFSWTPVAVVTTTATFNVSDGEFLTTHVVSLEIFETENNEDNGEENGLDGDDGEIQNLNSETTYLCGDIDQDGDVDEDDVELLVEIAFRGAPIPPLELVDFNGDGVPNVFDVVLLVDHVYRDGPPPCEAESPIIDIEDAACGDLNLDGDVNEEDIETLMDYTFRGVPITDLNFLDVNQDGELNVFDGVLLVDYILRGGDRPPFCSEEPPIEEPPAGGGGGGTTVVLSGGGGGGGSGSGGGGSTNLPPEFVNFTPPTSVASYDFYSYNAEATDPNGDALTFSLFDAPLGMAIIPETGIIYWYPQGDQEGGPHTVTVQVSDSANTVSETYEITVTPGTPPSPVISPTESIGSETPPSELGETESIGGETENAIPTENDREENLGVIGGTEDTAGTGLLAAIGAWLGDNLFIPILIVVIALILYLIYLAFVKRSKDEEIPPPTDSIQTGFSDY